MINPAKPIPAKDNRPKSLKEAKRKIDKLMSINEVGFPTKHSDGRKESVNENLFNPLEVGNQKNQCINGKTAAVKISPDTGRFIHIFSTGKNK